MPEMVTTDSATSERPKEIRFIHAADLHLDSQLKGLEAYEGAPAARIRNATRDAFSNLVHLAIAEKVEFVVIAGDLFDGKGTDQQTALWTAGQFRLLERAGIDVFLIRGNHDAAAEVRQRVQWPANVKEFPTDAPATLRHEKSGIALHGQGFAQRETTLDLAAGYPMALPGWFNLGVLHTSLTGDPAHDSYAPTREDVLVSKAYDYWALGHIHTSRILRERPAIAYSGCAQGRHIHEAGAKGCLLVTLRPTLTIEFRPLDVLRWQLLETTATVEGRLCDLYDQIRRELEQCSAACEGRFAAVRLIIRGQTAAHWELSQPLGHTDAVDEIRNIANSLDQVWVEKIEFQTTPPVDVARLRQGQDLLGEFLREIQELLDADDESLIRVLQDETSPLLNKAGQELRDGEIDLAEPQRLRRWLRQAENLVVARLHETPIEA